MTKDFLNPPMPKVHRPTSWDIVAIFGLILAVLTAIGVDWPGMNNRTRSLFVVILVVSSLWLLNKVFIKVRGFWRVAAYRIETYDKVFLAQKAALGDAAALRQKRNDQNVLMANIGSGRVHMNDDEYQLTGPHFRQEELCFVIPERGAPPLVVGSTVVVYDLIEGDELATLKVVSERPGERAYTAVAVETEQLFRQQAELCARTSSAYEMRGVVRHRTFTNLEPTT